MNEQAPDSDSSTGNPSDDHDSSLLVSSPGEEAGEHWGKQITRNLAALTVARGVSTVLKLVVTAYLTRILEPEAYGILGFGIALSSYFLMLTRLGFDVAGTRAVARNPNDVAKLASTITSVQLFLSVGTFCLYAALVLLLPKSMLVKSVLLVQGVTLFADAASLEWAYQGIERMGVLAARIIAISVLHLGTVLIIVHRPEDVLLAAVAQVGAPSILNVWLMINFVRSYGPLRIQFDLKAWKELFPIALPIAASVLMAGVFYNIDQVILGLVRTDAEVGLYSAGVRALIATLMPSWIIVQSFFPTLSNTHGDIEGTRKRARAFAAMMIPAGIPIAMVGILLAEPLLVLIAGEKFIPGTGAFALLMANSGVIYLNMTFGHPLIAWNRERTYMKVVGVVAVLDIVINLIFIPKYGIIGAASTTLAAQILLLVGFGAVHFRIVHQLYSDIIIRTVFATILGVVVPIWGLSRLHAPLVLILLAVGLAYGICLLMFRLARPRFLQSMLRS